MKVCEEFFYAEWSSFEDWLNQRQCENPTHVYWFRIRSRPNIKISNICKTNKEHSIFFRFGKLLLRMIGRKLLFTKLVLARCFSRSQRCFRYQIRSQIQVVPNKCFGRVGRNYFIIWATNLIFEEKNHDVPATSKWFDCALRLPSSDIDFLRAQTVCA